MFWFFGHEACEILAPQPGIEPAAPALEGEVLTTGLPGKSHMYLFELQFSLDVYPGVGLQDHMATLFLVF